MRPESAARQPGASAVMIGAGGPRARSSLLTSVIPSRADVSGLCSVTRYAPAAVPAKTSWTDAGGAGGAGGVGGAGVAVGAGWGGDVILSSWGGSSAMPCRTIWPWPTRAAAASSAGDIVGRGLSAPGWAPDAGDADRGDSDRGDSDDGDANDGDADDGDADRGDADRGDHLGEQLADTHMGEPLALRCFWSGGGLRASWANLHALP